MVKHYDIGGKHYISKVVRANSVNDALGKAFTAGYKYHGHICLKRAGKTQGAYTVFLQKR